MGASVVRSEMGEQQSQMPQVRAPGGAPTREPAGSAYRLHPAPRLTCGSYRHSLRGSPSRMQRCSMRDRPALVVALRLTSVIVRGRTIRKLRKSAGMTQAEMAALLRIPLLTLTRWEAGSRDLKAKVQHGLLAAQAKNKKGRRGAGLPFDHDQPPASVSARHRYSLDAMNACCATGPIQSTKPRDSLCGNEGLRRTGTHTPKGVVLPVAGLRSPRDTRCTTFQRPRSH
jgi:DNA-binding transcriptional regulator YiaG